MKDFITMIPEILPYDQKSVLFFQKFCVGCFHVSGFWFYGLIYHLIQSKKVLLNLIYTTLKI